MKMGEMLRIAMLNTDTPVPNVYSKRGSYGNIFHNLLQIAAQRVKPSIIVQSQDFDVVSGQYPESLADFDAILITGSAASSYDSADWIQRLDDYIDDVYITHPDIKIFGSCFGHQIVCQSLLRTYGAIVEKDPNGWELGVRDIQLSDEFCHQLLQPVLQQAAQSSGLESETNIPHESRKQEILRLQFVHADHVRLPPAGLPAGWTKIGSTKHCEVQGVYKPGHVLTYQGHFEFDRFINTETIKIFGSSWERERLVTALNDMDADDDSEIAADMVLRFLMGSDLRLPGSESRTGLLTPPEEHC